jgi:putative ABC transport system ATP-binding protein
MTNHPALLAEGVEKSYRPGDGAPPVPVLRDINLRVEPGEFVCLMGSSGSGKTTLLNLTGGLDVPDRGRIDVAGTDLQGLDDDARSAFRLRHIGFVFQFFHLLPNLTVAENIALPLLFLNESDAAAREAARALAREVGLGDKLERRANQLSGGEMQRVGLARALAHRPRLLLADEPTGNLDSRTGATILDLLRSIGRDHGATIVMATHDQAAARVADRVVRMSDGRIMAEV